MTQCQANLAEMQAVRIGAQPFDFRRLLIMRHIGVRNLAAVQIGVFLELKMVNVPAVWIRERVPAPVRQGAERRRFFKRFGKRLQAGGIHRETKFAVADRQRI